MVKGNKGFSLILVLFITGILGVLSAGAFTYVQMNQKHLARIEVKQAADGVSMEMGAVLGSKALCDAALVPGQAMNLQQASQAFTIDNNGRKKFNSQGGFELSMQTDLGLMSSGQNLVGYPLRVDALKIYDATLYQETFITNVYKVRLVGYFSSDVEKFGRFVSAGPRDMGSFYLETDKNNNNEILECVNTNLTDNDSMKKLEALNCDRLMGSYDPVSGQCDLIPYVCSVVNGTYANGTCTPPPVENRTVTNTTVVQAPPSNNNNGSNQGSNNSGFRSCGGTPHGGYRENGMFCSERCVNGAWVRAYQTASCGG